MILLPDCDEFCATDKAEKLREIIEDLSPSGLRVTASFGVCELRPDIADADGWVREADALLYEAKRAGRDRIAQARDLAPERVLPGKVLGTLALRKPRSRQDVLRSPLLQTRGRRRSV